VRAERNPRRNKAQPPAGGAGGGVRTPFGWLAYRWQVENLWLMKNHFHVAATISRPHQWPAEKRNKRLTIIALSDRYVPYRDQVNTRWTEP
jgi:hypothetical protein